LAYPGLGSYAGKLGWTSTGQYDAEVAKANQELEPLYASFNAQTPEQLAGDPKAMAVGERLFMNNCAQCHGSDARGSKGFPNLTDGDWLHGGTSDKIKETITKGRIGQMPPMAAAVGSPDDIRNVSHHMTLCALLWVNQNSVPAQPVTVQMARACKRWAQPT
jgi:cytochrome c oxidase cbb3-type subunit 3